MCVTDNETAFVCAQRISDSRSIEIVNCMRKLDDETSPAATHILCAIVKEATNSADMRRRRRATATMNLHTFSMVLFGDQPHGMPFDNFHLCHSLQMKVAANTPAAA